MKKVLLLTIISVMVIVAAGCNNYSENSAKSSSAIVIEKTSSNKDSSANVSETSSTISSSEIVVEDAASKPTASKSDSVETVLPNISDENEIDESLYYKNENVISVYAVDVDDYVMAEMSRDDEMAEILSVLENYKSSEINENNLAFLVFTQNGRREYIYLDKSNAELIKQCKTALDTKLLHPNWLIHMTPEKMVSATISSTGDTTGEKKLHRLSDYLKNEVTVSRETTSYKGPTNPLMMITLFHMSIDFDSKTTYTLIGYEESDGLGDLSIHTSDLDITVRYEVDKGVYPKLRAFLESLAK